MKKKKDRPKADGRHDELLRGTRPAIDARLINDIVNAKDPGASKSGRTTKSDVGTTRIKVRSARRTRTTH